VEGVVPAVLADPLDPVVPEGDELVEDFDVRVLDLVDVLVLLDVELVDFPLVRVDVLLDEVVFDAGVLFARALVDFVVLRLVLRVVRFAGDFAPGGCALVELAFSLS
jgi:hypothetical protein